MKSNKENTNATSCDIESLNEGILRIDLSDLDVEVLDDRIELTLASWFGGEGDGEGGGRPGCGQFTCAGYWPTEA